MIFSINLLRFLTKLRYFFLKSINYSTLNIPGTLSDIPLIFSQDYSDSSRILLEIHLNQKKKLFFQCQIIPFKFWDYPEIPMEFFQISLADLFSNLCYANPSEIFREIVTKLLKNGF